MPEHQFELLREERLDELNTRARLYRHRTGAQLLSLANDDENKVFGINFRTPPEDSTGVAHILEHSVLCVRHSGAAECGGNVCQMSEQ